MTKPRRIKLERAASQLGSELWGVPWRVLHGKWLKWSLIEGKLTDPPEWWEEWIAFYVALHGEVLDRLRDGRWVAWGCWQSGIRPAEIPIELWERDDVELELVGRPGFPANRVDWANSNWIDQITVVEAAPARVKPSLATITREFTAWVKDQLEWPTKEEANIWALAEGYSTTIVRKLQSARTPRGRGIRKRQN